jgi:hypothetical protein
MAKPAVPPTATDDEVRAFLVRYRCPVPFHEVRTRFLGNIASPGIGVSPIKVVEGRWGGTLPEFETTDAANELIGALVMGLWNRLSRHQDRSAPFRLGCTGRARRGDCRPTHYRQSRGGRQADFGPPVCNPCWLVMNDDRPALFVADGGG